MSTLHFSLIFVNYQSAHHLANVLKSLFNCEKERDIYEIIVVNNDIAEREKLKELQKIHQFSLIESGGNVGFGKANNLGAKQARGAILGFINPDIIWTGAILNEIKRSFNKEDRIGILGPALLDKNKKPENWSYGKAPSLGNLVRNNFFPTLRYPQNKKIYPDWVSGGALFIRAALFSETDGFDEGFFLYFEDADLCAAVRRCGFDVARYNNLTLVHLGGGSRHSAQEQKKYFYASQRKYFEKWRPKWESFALRHLQKFFGKM